MLNAARDQTDGQNGRQTEVWELLQMVKLLMMKVGSGDAAALDKGQKKHLTRFRAKKVHLF